LTLAGCLKALFDDKGVLYLPKMEFQKLSSYLSVMKKKFLCPEIILWKTEWFEYSSGSDTQCIEI
jgi:hypothetical protein